VIAGSEERPEGIVALTPGPGGTLEPISGRQLGEPVDAVYDGERGARALSQRLIELGRALHFRRLSPDSALPNALSQELEGRGITVIRPMPGTPVVELDPARPDPEAQVSSRRRSDLRRARRRAEESGRIETEVLAPSPDEVDGLLRVAFDVEAASWKGAAGSALLHDRMRRPFFESWAARAATRGELRIAFMRIGGTPAAMQLACARGNAYWTLKIGYDERFARASPGVLLFVETLRWAAQSGLERYELLGHPEEWTRVWGAKTERPTIRVVVIPASWRAPVGAAALAMGSMGDRVKRPRERSPAHS
jgi:CelD/BcsL family acetyltransferase involved in cellulose biosynthesis